MNTDKNIGRRTAIKLIGTFAASATMAAMGFSAAAENSLKNNGTPRRRLVFYFTATGNSLYVARALSTEPISIPQALKEGKLDYEADEIGFVFPDYAASAPLIVREFVEKARLKAPYIFSIITYGNYAANVADWWNDFCRQKNVTNNYINTMLMVDNYLPVFDMNEQISAKSAFAGIAILFEICLIELGNCVKWNYIRFVVKVGVTGSGYNQELFVIPS